MFNKKSQLFFFFKDSCEKLVKRGEALRSLTNKQILTFDTVTFLLSDTQGRP